MAVTDGDGPSELERQLQRLEETVQRFSDAVDLWTQWKDEYEALRDAVQLLPADATREDRTATRNDYEGDLIDDKELVDIFGKDDSRKPDQILSVLTNRLDYVAKNIATLNRKLEDARENLSRAENPDAYLDNDDGDDSLPMTEIVEQLDDDDNVISYSLRTPGKSEAQLFKALEKAGLKDAGDSVATEAAQKSSQEASGSSTVNGDSQARTNTSPRPAEPSEPTKPKAEKSAPKKTVTFTEDTKEEQEPRPNRPAPARTIEDILREAAEQQISITDPVIPADDSPEDADLREDMLRYNRETMMYEMAPIVAELQLEEGSDIDTEDDWDEDEDEDDDEDEEDQWGRSTKSVLTDDWKQQMLELKERLSHHTFGKPAASGDAQGEDDDEDEQTEGLGRISIRREDTPAEAAAVVDRAPSITKQDSTQAKKGVRFASKLDIADESKPAAAPKPAADPPLKPLIDPLSDIVERKSPACTAAPKTANPPSKKPSRFKKSLPSTQTQQLPTAPIAANGTPIAPEEPVDNTRYAPSGPEGQTLAETVLEREPSGAVVEPDEFDATLMHQQATEEYYKMRNRLVHRQGGFVKEDESAVQPLAEEEGGPRKVSRFKAARLGKP